MPAEPRRRLAAILAADASGYSRLMAADEQSTIEALNAHRAVFRTRAAARGGRIVDTAGDSVLAVFESVVEAGRCAIEIQREIESCNEALPADRRLQFRVGVNLGDIIESDDGTIYGDGVNIAARLQALVAPGGIAISGEAHDMLEGKIEHPMRSLGQHEVKNIPRPLRVYTLEWADAGETPLRSAKPVDQAAISSIAVLPITNLSRHEEDDEFADGLVEEIIAVLSQGKYYRHYSRTPLKVASRTASFRFEPGGDVTAIARQLGVGYVLEGSVRRIASSMRISAQLIRAQDGFHVWSKSYERDVAGGFEMQTRLARNIAHLTTAELLFDLWKRRALAGESFPGVKLAAIEHFLNAEYQYRLIRLGEGGDWGLYEQLLRKATNADPEFAVAHTILAFVYMKRIGGQLPLRDALVAAHASIDRALALTPDGVLTLWQLGEIQLNLDLDYAKAESTFQKVLERAPDRIWMHYNLATIAVREGRAREALRLLGTAAALDAGYEQGGFLNSYAWLLQILGQYEESLRIAAQGLDLAWGGQERATNLRSQALALVSLDRVEEARPLIAESWELSGRLNPESHAFLLARTGEVERARRVLDDARDEGSDRHAVALGELALGSLDAAFSTIEAGIEEHDPLLADSLRSAAWWDGLRSDPRYHVAVEKLEAEEAHTGRFSKAHAAERPRP